MYNKKNKGEIFFGNQIIKNGNGKVKEYFINGKLRFEDEYLNRKKHGKEKEYFSNGKLRFEGKYKFQFI